MPPLRIGMFGGGVVGGGVYEIIEHLKKAFFKSLGAEISIVKICVKDASKPRSFTVGPHTSIVTDYESILGDDSINCVLELMGGTTHAKEAVFEAIRRGKSVVTANKALLAQYLPEIREMLKARPEVRLGYEAAVCGGIPIISSLQHDFVGDDISRVSGIMNGTTNFMLCALEQEGADYAAVLKQAQDLGYAEADPTADVEGHDVQAKIALLAKLAFGHDVPVASVPCTGISKLTGADFSLAKSLGCTIKLLGTAAQTAPPAAAAPGCLTVYVSPTLVPLGGALAAARGPGNVVVVESKNMGQAAFAGPGAGRYPTANSVVSDVVRVATGACGEPWPVDRDWKMDSDYSARFFVRIQVSAARAGPAVLRAVAAAAEEAGVAVDAVLPAPAGGGSSGGADLAKPTALTTGQCRLSQVQAMCTALASQPWSAGAPLFMPMA